MILSEAEKLSILLKISNKLFESQSISSYEYELFNLIKRESNNSYEINNVKKIGEENNSNEEKIENRITNEKIKTNIEKIMSYIKDKKDYEFISDFFITESTSPSININNDITKINNQKSNNIEFDEINDDFLKEFLNTHLTDINSITEFNKKIKQNKNINNEFDINLIYPQKKSSKEDLFLDDIRKAENFKNKKIEKEQPIKNKELLEKEMDEEINREIFGYTRKMKESARNFGVQMKKDNKTLSGIENLQERANDKTNKVVGRLKKFNFSIRLGICKLIMMTMIVFGTFFGIYIFISIFPKLV